jgi:diaminopimelate epimerase
MQLTINQNNTVSVDMGIPKLRPEDIPFLTSQQAPSYELLLNDEQTVPIHTINVGNPHAVLLVDDIQAAPVNQLGPQISVHQQFPEQTNTGFMQIINSQHIHLRVFERGCGETRACGSGAVAAAAIGQLYYNLAEQVKVSLLGGELIIDWPHKDASIRLTGPASFVYEATLFDPL